MDATGAARTITVGGKTVRVTQLTLNMWGELSALAAAKRAGVLDLALQRAANQPPAIQDKLITAAVNAACPTSVTQEDVGRFIALPDGLIQFARLLLREHQPELSVDEIRTWLGPLPPDVVAQLFARATGMELSQKNGQAAETTAA